MRTSCGRPNRGLISSLAEVLVSCSILLVVTGIAYDVMVLADGYATAGQTRSSLQLNAAFSVQRLYFDMHESGVSSVTTLNTPQSSTVATPIYPQAVSFLTSRNTIGQAVTDDNGLPLWQAFVIYYVPSGNSQYPLLSQRVVPANSGLPSTTLSALTPGQLQGYCSMGGTEMAYGVVALNITLNSSADCAVINVITQDQPGSYSRNMADYNSTVYFDN